MRRFLCLGLGVLMAAGCGSASVATTTAREAGSSASCAALTPAEQLAAARLVFVGVVLPGPTTSPARMRVERYLKGSGPGVVTVKTAESRSGTVAEDGIEPRPGERWQIYTRSRAQPFDTSICAGSARVIRPAVPTPANSAAALALWSSFPVDANPRPVVPLDEDLVLDPASGFTTGAAKIAYLERHVVLRGPLPASARLAYRRLNARAIHATENFPPLVITAVKPGTATFMTDRGRMRLPVWEFHFRGVADPASVLALAAPELFIPPPLHQFGPPGPGSSGLASGKLSPSGTVITISFFGDQTGKSGCGVSYRAGAVSDRRAVAYTITAITTPALGAPGQVCVGVGSKRIALLRLARPLGARVLVSAADGGAISVTGR